MDLKRWSFPPHEPMRKAYEQSPAAVKSWLEQDCSAITARAKNEGAEISCSYEIGLRIDCVRRRGDASIGHAPLRACEQQAPR